LIRLLAPKPGTRWAGFLNKGAGFAVVAGLVLTGAGAGMLKPVDEALGRLRFEVLKRPASGTLTVVEIDTASVRAAGRWPWGRERFAQAIENLQAAGAETIAFDVDFSARSSPEGDRALEAAVGRKPGAVVLPTFVQTVRQGGQEVQIENSPLGSLSAQAVLASVNVPVDTDGRVRRYVYGFGEGEAWRASVGALLAGAPHGRTGAFLIDYGIDHRVPAVSFEDVYQGRFDPAAVRGKKVLIGATALELGDEFATVKRGTLPGVLVHALAYESALAGRALTQLHPWIVLLASGWAIWLLRPGTVPDVRRLVRRHAAVGAVALIGPLALQAGAPVVAETSPVLLAQALCLIWATRVELLRRAEAIVQEREASLLYQALTEPETEMPNRRALLMDVAQRVDARDGRATAVVAVGIDRVATLRGAVGYQRFNAVVLQVAARIAEITGETMVGHLSTSVLGVPLTAETMEAVHSKVQALEAMDPAMKVEDLSVDAFVRLGVAFAGDDDTAESLLESASIALDRARERDGRVAVFDREQFVDPSLNLALMTDMRVGLQAGELELHYQPKADARTREVVGAEALVRWRHPKRGPISPEVLIGTAEETGMIRMLTDWGLAQAAADAKRLRSRGHRVPIAVNISAGLLADREFKSRTLAAVGGVEDMLCLEITESAIIQNPDRALQAIAEFRAAGLKVSIDDYGTGLSSLAYLKMIEADELKIDRSLVSAASELARDRLILKSTVDLAHGLGMSVVAEGVEDEETLAALSEIGCDTIQGWLIAKAMPLPELMKFLQQPRQNAA
jgi:diguanylate cyclase